MHARPCPCAAVCRRTRVRNSSGTMDNRSRAYMSFLTQDDTVLGGVTDPDGIYLISRVPEGRYILQASFIGFETFTDTLDLAAGDSRHLDIALAAQQAENRRSRRRGRTGNRRRPRDRRPATSAPAGHRIDPFAQRFRRSRQLSGRPTRRGIHGRSWRTGIYPGRGNPPRTSRCSTGCTSTSRFTCWGSIRRFPRTSSITRISTQADSAPNFPGVFPP